MKRIVQWSIEHRWIVIGLSALLFAAGNRMPGRDDDPTAENTVPITSCQKRAGALTEESVMNMDVAFLLTLFILFVALLASPIFLPKQKAAEEKNLTPLFEESCVVGRDFGSGSSFAHNMFLWRVSLYSRPGLPKPIRR
jgi:hypothetical protein